MLALKKIIGSILLCSFLFNFGIDADLNKESSRLFDNFRRAKNKTALVSNDNSNVFGVGYSIDVVKSKYLDAEDVKDGSPMLDEDWLKNTLANQSVNSIFKSDVYSMSDNSFESLLSSFDAKFSFSSNIGGTYDVFTANLSDGFKVRANMTYRNAASKYFYCLNYLYKNYEISLPKYSSNLIDIRNHLTPEYIEAVTNVLNGKLNYSTFFDTFGTHLIAKGIFGGKVEAYYSLISNDCYLGGDVKAELDSSIKAGIENCVEIGSNFSYSFKNATGINATHVKEQFRVNATGGEAFSATGINNFSTAFQSWTKSLSDKSGLIGSSQDGLIPVWNLLPSNLSTSSNIEKLKSYFRSYASRYYSDVNYNYYTSSELFVPEHRDNVEYFDYLINCEGTVYTKEGLQSDPLVWFVLDNGEGDYTCRFIRAFGYKRASISLYMDIKEINDGYQYIHLYNGPKDSYRCLGEKRYEHVPGKLDTEYSQAVIGFDIKLSDLNKIDDKYENKLFFYFSESGYGNNDWKYKHPRVLVTYYKD